MIYASVNDIIKGIPLERLAEICEAERDGRCAVLPCKVGNTIYEPYNEGIDSAKVQNVYVEIETDTCVFAPCDIGKTVFLTREAAESALKGESHER